jgi:hypothetical protein
MQVSTLLSAVKSWDKLMDRHRQSVLQRKVSKMSLCYFTHLITVTVTLKLKCNILWRVRVAPPIIAGSGSDDWILLAAHITTCLNYSHSFIALSLFHMFNNHCSQQSTQSLCPAVFISNCLLLEHSNPLTALTACTHKYANSHTVTILTSSRTLCSQLYCLNYTTAD